MSEIRNPRLEKSKTGTGVWEVRWTEWRGDRFVSRSLSTRTADRVSAEKFFTGFLDADARSTQAAGSPLLDDLCVAYSSALKAKGAGETQLICLAHIRRWFGHVRLCDLTPEKVFDYCAKRGVQSGTLRRELLTLRAALGYAAKTRKIDKADIPSLDLPRPSQAREVYLNDAEEREFHALAMRHSDGLKRLSRLSRFVALALDTAARKEAIEGLTWGRVDLVTGHIDYREPGRALTNKRRAVVPIAARLRPILERAYQERKTDYVLDHGGAIRKTWETWIKTTGFTHITPHDLRRTWATLAASHGVPIVTIAGILADDPETVFKHYAKFIPGDAQSAVDARFPAPVPEDEI